MNHSAMILLSHQQQQCWQQQEHHWLSVDDPGQLAPETPVSVICDLTNEHCQHLKLPPLNKRHRQALLERQLQQQWPQSRWRNSLPRLTSSSRSMLGQTSDTMNFSLFGMDETPPLRALLQHPHLKVVALYPLSLLILSLLPEHSHRHWLLVVISHTSQLRILALDRGLLVVNRLLTELSDPSTQVHEVERTRRYLESQFDLSHKDSCPLIWLGAHQETRSLLNDAQFQQLPAPNGWHTPEALCSAPRLHDLIRRAPTHAQLLPQHSQHVTTPPWFNRAAIAGILLGASTIAGLHWQTHERTRHISAQQSQLSQLRQQQQAIEMQLAAQPVSLEQLQQLQAWQARAHATPAMLRQHLLQLSNNLQLDPHGRVQHLSWQLSEAACAASHDASSTIQSPSQQPQTFAELRFQLMQFDWPRTPQAPGRAVLNTEQIHASGHASDQELASAPAYHAYSLTSPGCLKLPLVQEPSS